MNPDLILRDKEGEIYSVRYDAVNAMLLNELKSIARMRTASGHHAVEIYGFEARGNIAQQQRKVRRGMRDSKKSVTRVN